MKKECNKRYTTLSIRHGSVFNGSKVELLRLFKLLFFWSKETNISKAIEFVGIGRKTVGELYSRLRHAVSESFSATPMRLGGHNVICQIDESLFNHKQKYHVGRASDAQVWVFGIADTSRRPCAGYMKIVSDRSEATLLPIVERVCRPGTIIHSDQWRGYLNIKRNLSLSHRTVNHSVNFVNPETGVHTQAIESYWAKQKLRIKAMKGMPKDKLSEYLVEFMWRDSVGRNAFAELINILRV